MLGYLRPVDIRDMNLYVNFLARALVPSHGNSDVFYQRFRAPIERAACLLRTRLGVQQEVLWRGVLVSPETVRDGWLSPIPHIQSLSFTESRSVAEVFADMRSRMSFLVRLHYPGHRGYLIQHTPSPAEVLFSYRCCESLNLFEIGITHLDRKTVLEQQEVLLRQTGRRFRVLAHEVCHEP